MANIDPKLQSLRYGIERLRALFPKEFGQRQQYKQRNAANHPAPKRDGSYGPGSGELNNRADAENDFNN